MKSKIPNIQDCISHFIEFNRRENGIEYEVCFLRWTEPLLNKMKVNKNGTRFIMIKEPKHNFFMRYAFTPIGEKFPSDGNTIYLSITYLRDFYQRAIVVDKKP